MSRAVTSSQPGMHQRLDDIVRRHLTTTFRRPYAPHSVTSFEQLARRVDAHGGPLVFDSFCGVGESTAALARRHPEALVIGLDKSRYRLAKHEQAYRDSALHNYLLLQADVNDLWRQALAAGWRLSHHYLLYPNPWPKPAHLQRRVHGSPVFPTLLALGGTLELRSNWRLYMEEFARALTLAGHRAHIDTPPPPALTPFERKYSAAGQQLYRCRTQLGP